MPSFPTSNYLQSPATTNSPVDFRRATAHLDNCIDALSGGLTNVN